MSMEFYVPRSIDAARAAEAAITALEVAGFAMHVRRLAAATKSFQAETIPSRLRLVKAEARQAAEAAEEAVAEWQFRGDGPQAALVRAAADAAWRAEKQALAALAPTYGEGKQ